MTRMVEPESGAEDKSGALKRRIFLAAVFLVVACVIAYALMGLVGPDWLYAKFHLGGWGVEQVVIVDDPSAPRLVVNSFSGAENIESTPLGRVSVLSYSDGAVEAEYYRTVPLRMLGVTGDTVWLYENDDKLSSRALSIPDLNERVTFEELLEMNPALQGIVRDVEVDGFADDLRILGRDGYQYKLNIGTGATTNLGPGPAEADFGLQGLKVEPTFLAKRKPCTSRVPGQLNDRSLVEPWSVCDYRTGEVITVNGDQIVHHQNLTGSTGKLIISRVSTGGGWTWSEADLFLDVDEDENGRRVEWSTLHHGTLVLVLKRYQSAGSVDVVLLEPDSGKLLWRTKLN